VFLAIKLILLIVLRTRIKRRLNRIHHAQNPKYIRISKRNSNPISWMHAILLRCH